MIIGPAPSRETALDSLAPWAGLEHRVLRNVPVLRLHQQGEDGALGELQGFRQDAGFSIEVR
jgi:hypothetical protein